MPACVTPGRHFYRGRMKKLGLRFPWNDSLGSLDNYPYSSSGKVLAEHSLDRINCNLGYVEGNLRWADMYTQAANKSWKKPNSTSEYIGVIYCSTNKAWIAKLQHKGEVHHLYYGDSEEEAYFARKKFIQANDLPHAY